MWSRCFPTGCVWNEHSCRETSCWTARMPADRMRRGKGGVRGGLSVRRAGGLKAPQIGFVTVPAVETSPDLRHARVFVSVLGDETDRDRTLAGLASSHGVLQAAIAS